MLYIAAVVIVVVFVAMMIDLWSGLRKAKQRGEVRTSQSLKRTITKFIMYEGSVVIALCADVLIHLSRILQLFGLDVIYGAPVIACLVGVFLCAVEFMSVREKADQKTKKEINNTAEVLAKLLQNDSLKDVIRVAMEQQAKAKTVEEEAA